MLNSRLIITTLGMALAVASVVGSPAVSRFIDAVKPSKILNFGNAASATFTPAGADPKLAAIMDRYNVRTGKFAFTPATTRIEGAPITVTVAVRSTPSLTLPVRPTVQIATVVAPKPQPEGVEMMPMAYKLGSSVGWSKFATPGSVKPFDVESKLLGKSDSKLLGKSDFKLPTEPVKPRRLATRMQLESEQLGDAVTRAQYRDKSIGVDLEGSYRLTKKLNLTAGVKYKAERDRLDRAPDAVRDNQAVYIGTRFRF